MNLTLYPVDINFQKLLNYKKRKILYSILIIKICSKIFSKRTINHLPKVFIEKVDSMNKFVDKSNLSKTQT